MQIEEYPKRFKFACDERVLVVDPGVTTGVNLCVDGIVTAYQIGVLGRFDASLCAIWICDLFVEHSVELAVLEDFVLRPDAAPGGRDGTSPERMLGAIVGIGADRGILSERNTVFPMPAVKNQIDDVRLGKLGIVYSPKHYWRHAADTSRHLVQAKRKGFR